MNQCAIDRVDEPMINHMLLSSGLLVDVCDIKKNFWKNVEDWENKIRQS